MDIVGRQKMCDGPAELRDLIPMAYDALRQAARHRMAHNAAGITLTPTDLVNEVLLRLLKREGVKYNGEDHLLSVAALAMHHILVDRARRRAAAKRGGFRIRVDLDDDLEIESPVEDMLGFHEACDGLRDYSEEHFELVLLRVYAGLSCKEIAVRRKQSCRTVERQWKFVKAVLQTRLRFDECRIHPAQV